MPDTTTIPVNVILASNSPRRKQLLDRRILQLHAKHPQHLFTCLHNVADRTSVVEQAVVIPIFRIKIDLD